MANVLRAEERLELDARGLARMCSGLSSQLAASVEGPTGRDIRHLQNHLSSLASLLETAPSPESLPGLGTALQDCNLALIGIKELIASGTATEDSPGNKPAIQTTNKEQIASRMHDLLDARNALSLSLYLENNKVDDFKVKMLKQDLDKLSGEAMSVADNFFARGSPRQSRGQLAVQELEISVPKHRTRRSAEYETMCPNTRFLSGSGDGHRYEIVKFICCCDGRGGSHDAELEYRVSHVFFSQPPSPLELIRPRKARTWQIVFFKPSSKAMVSVRLAALVPTYIPEIQQRVLSLALRYIKHHKGSLYNVAPWYVVFSPDSDSLLLQTATCGSLGRMPQYVEVRIGQRPIKFDWKPQDIHMQAFHYSQTTLSELATWKGDQPARLLPQSHARLVVNHDPNHDTLIIAIYIKSAVEQQHHSRRPFWVTLSNVEIIKPHQPGECAVDFHFGRPEDAENFAEHIKEMHLRLRREFAQGPFSNETEIYVREPAASPLDPDDEPKTRLSIIASKKEPGAREKMRMIVTKDGCSGSVCLDFDENAFKVAKSGLQNSQDLIKFWRHEYDGLQVPILQSTNWDKLTSQRNRRVTAHRVKPAGGPQVMSNPKRTADDWLDDIDILKDAMTASDSEGDYARVKVCVIDTGFRFQKDDPHRGNVVKEYIDFVEPSSQERRDETWHGTLCASIILSIYDDCELYVARVFKDNNADEMTGPSLMAKAIEWAVDEKNVDIISISAGFRNHSMALQDAVRKASGAGKLIFAAASNWGNVSGAVAYPARYQQHAICIFSTDTENKESAFNPEPREDAPNFALLGEQWQSPEDPVTVVKREKGTSMATAAAAGLAALILDFSRQRDIHQRIFRAPDVGRMAGMIAIFNHISKPCGKYKCVMPMEMLPADYDKLDRTEQRDYVRHTISWAMKRAN